MDFFLGTALQARTAWTTSVLNIWFLFLNSFFVIFLLAEIKQLSVSFMHVMHVLILCCQTCVTVSNVGV